MKTIISSFALVIFLSISTVIAASKPNVILIMTDDMGAEGLGSYGSTIYTTPHLDRMAEEGVRFNNAYATPLCTPTRVMIMSGLYPNRTGFRNLIYKGKGARMHANIKTFGNYFRDAGYETAIAGKWQLGQFNDYPNQPVEHGFDEYSLWTWVYNKEKSSRFYSPQIYTNGEIFNGTEKDYGPDFYSKFVLDSIDKNKDKPFFIYFPMALVHYPFVHPPKLEELARTKFTDDMEESEVAFGHMITYMDDIVGKIMKRLKDHGIDNNTLLIFTGDNGTLKSIKSKLPGMDLMGGKGSLSEAGCRVPFLAWWPGRIKPAVQDELFSLVDVLPTITSLAGIELTAKVDGMDLSHNLFGEEGKNREYIKMNYKKGFFVRDKRFRLHEDGKFYDIPVTSDKERYSEKLSDNPEHESRRKQLQTVLDEFMAIEQEYGSKAKKNKAKQSKE
ncbi:sulfatase-like hydrolase/transferase [Lentisphaera marina]|uniref:sulfatase-like hydrolase/transferase n=1 Tax=Lentisphaera marina TaxID=1111041 RepID=UPI002365F5BE|nr:sulfatase-like hydrolase/transferase [Lentisphaera marina]MDD7987263.1 sulfatase-like hydrolase/transferase [Lentisphaera marina]